MSSEVVSVIVSNLKLRTSGPYGCNRDKDGKEVTWEVAWNLTPEFDVDVFDFYPLFHTTLVAAKKELHTREEDVGEPQFILDYTDKDWLLNFEYYDNDCASDRRFSMAVRLQEPEVVKILSHVVNNHHSIYDLSGPIV